MATSIVLDGITFTDTDFAGLGYTDNVVVNGTSYPRFQALFVAALEEIETQAGAVSGAVIAVRSNFNATTTDADPGSGNFRLNNADTSLVTEIYVDDLDASGNNVAAQLATWDDSTSVVKGYLGVIDPSNAANYALYQVTGITVNSGYTTITVTYISASATLPFTATQTYAISFSRTGDKGDTGNIGDIPAQTATTTLEDADLLVVYDDSAAATRKITVANAKSAFGGSGGATETTASGDITLTSASTRVQSIDPNGADRTVTLPDATTIDEGTPIFVIHHTGTANKIAVRDNSGSLIAWLTTGEILTCALENNNTAAGTWARFIGTNSSGFFLLETDVFESASSSNISASQLTTDKIIFAYTDGGNSSRPTAVVIDYSGTSPSVGTAVEIATGSSATGVSVAGITATTAICAYANGTTSGVAVVLSVSGVAITVETADGDTFEAAECRFISVDVCSSSLAIVSYRDVGNTDFPTACSIAIANGTELTAGTPVQISASGCSFTKIRAINATQAMVFWRQSNSGRVVVVTESSGLSVGTFQQVSTNAVFADIAILSSTRAFVYYDESNAATVTAIAISGAALTVGNSTSIQTPSTGGTTGHGLIALSSETAFAHHSDDNASIVYVQEIAWNSGTPLASKQITFAIDGGNFTSALVDTKKYAIGYDDDGNSSYGTSSLIEELA